MSIFANTRLDLRWIPRIPHPSIKKTHSVTLHFELRAHAVTRFRGGWNEGTINPMLGCSTVLKVSQLAGAYLISSRATHRLWPTKCSHPNEVMVETDESAPHLARLHDELVTTDYPEFTTPFSACPCIYVDVYLGNLWLDTQVVGSRFYLLLTTSQLRIVILPVLK
jgi:hypothetical protein